MELTDNFQQTVVGIIPANWKVVKLSEFLLRAPEYGINAPAVRYSDNLPTYLRITDITDDGLFSRENIHSVDHPNFERYFLTDDDIVFARTGASVGKSYLYNPNDGQLVFAGFLIRIKIDKSKLLPEYLAYYIKTNKYWNWVKLMSMRSGQPGINGNEYSQLPFAIPPTVDEEKAIVTVLNDIDALITSLDKLIAKKRMIKQAAMQELLTGKTRLPGYNENWEVISLGSLGEFRGGSGFPIAYQGDTEVDYPFFKVSDMNNSGNATFMTNANNWISEYTRQILNARAFPKNTIVFAKIGAAIYLERKRIISQTSCLDNNMMGFTIKQDMASLKYIYFLFETIQLGKLVAATALPSLSGNQIAALTYPLPPLAEQKAIATILSDMDIEIATLEQRREKTSLLKQGMMQELLTGRIRLI